MPNSGPASDSEAGLLISIMGGGLTHLDEIALPFQKRLIAELEALGYRNEDTETVRRAFPNVPPFPKDRGPTSALGPQEITVGFGIYVGLRLADGLLSQLAADRYEQVAKTAFGRLRDTVRGRPDSPTVRAVIEHWFDDPGVLVRVVAHDAAADEVHEHVPAALRRAQSWLDGHDEPPRVLTFEVRGGKLDQGPAVS